jgi:SnoaL-like domain
MPFTPELFSASTLQQVQERRQRKLLAVPYFDGLMSGEIDALVNSFATMPELHDPVRGRVKGTRAFETFVSETSSWLRERNVFEEVILHFDSDDGRVDLPVAVVADRRCDAGIEELRIYFSNWPRDGRHAHRPPLLQPDPDLRESDVVGDYQRALAAGDVDAIVATFEPDGYAREPAGNGHVHSGRDGLRSFYELMFSNGGGIPLEHCTVIDDEHACGLEYNVVRWGETQLEPEAGFACYMRGAGGKLAAARIYDDADPPL